MRINGKYIIKDELPEEARGFARLSFHGHGKSRNDVMSPCLEYRDDLGRMWVITGYDLKSLFCQFFELGLNPEVDGVKTLKSDHRTSTKTLQKVADKLGLIPVFNKWNEWSNC